MLLKILLGFATFQLFLKQWAKARLVDFMIAAKAKGEDVYALGAELQKGGPAKCYEVCAKRGDTLTPWILILGLVLHYPARIALAVSFILLLTMYL